MFLLYKLFVFKYIDEKYAIKYKSNIDTKKSDHKLTVCSRSDIVEQLKGYRYVSMLLRTCSYLTDDTFRTPPIIYL